MTAPHGATALLRRYTTLFWDFDGVIKESLTVKSEAFERLFAPFGAAVAARVRAHHESHSGMPRTEKLPLYLEWAGQGTAPAEVGAYAERFSRTVFAAVIRCPWVAGAREYLQANHPRQRCVLVSATPLEELTAILHALGASTWFTEVFGAPVAKSAAITAVLTRTGCRGRDALMIGDSAADCEAAAVAGVDFLLRRTPHNRELQQSFPGPQCEHFIDG